MSIFVATYVEVAPSAVEAAASLLRREREATRNDVTPPNKDAATAALEQLAAESATHQGNYRFFVWQQLDRPNHFTLVETWADRDALEAHGKAAATIAFRRTLAPMLGALYDDRWYRVLD